MPIGYRIENFNTQWYLTTREMKSGTAVTTANGKDDVPADTKLIVFPPMDVHNPVTIATIRAPNGLYVALPEGASGGTSLIWSGDEFRWVVKRTDRSSSIISPANGADLYWIDKFGTGPVFLVQPDSNVKPPENEFWIIPIPDN